MKKHLRWARLAILFFVAVTTFVPLFVSRADGPGFSVITVADTINPGTGDYIINAIREAEKTGATGLILQLDTPGGLLSTTRQIVQEMLNTSIPVVVFIGPRGAHAGSAGALITFAADVAAMAPGTNIGAAHPVNAGGGDDPDKTMKEKIANDTAAFAEGLAKAKGRNAEWAIKAVRNSASIIADEALKLKVVDLIAEDLPDLQKKLSGHKFNVAKKNIKGFPEGEIPVKHSKMSIKQRLVSFFADPSLAYMILTLGGLCIWIELSHPGLILPGVVGVFCVLISMIAFQMLPISYGALAFIIVGLAMVVAEIYLPTYGLLGAGGILAFVLGSLFLMDTDVPAFQLSLSLILPTAAVLAGFAFLIGALVLETRKAKQRSGMEALIGEQAVVREEITATDGRVFVQGELWNAVTEDEHKIGVHEPVTVTKVKNLVLVVKRS